MAEIPLADDSQTADTDLHQQSDDETRRAKIEAIRQQLAAGSYLISGKDVAGKILEVIKG